MNYFLKYFILFLIVAITSCNSGDKTTETVQKLVPTFSRGDITKSTNFTGTVWVNIMGANDSTLHTRFGNVTFAPKARTNWHSHPGGQILLIIDGAGYYQAKGQPAQLLKVGDVVEIPRDVVHWHGASPGSEFAHIALSLNIDDGGAVWSGPVTDEEYELATN